VLLYVEAILFSSVIPKSRSINPGWSNGQRMFNFQADIAKLRALIREIGDVVLVIIDPVTAYMGKIIQTISCALRTL
jgi:hypothetical protein